MLIINYAHETFNHSLASPASVIVTPPASTISLKSC